MTINCKGKLIEFSTPVIMGILNITPDSFYDGGKYKNEKEILHQVERMLNDGATFIDVGAYSSRPGANDIAIDEEKKRLIPVLDVLNEHFGHDILMSVDTFRSEIAQIAIQHKAALINDISGGTLDKNMFGIIAKYNVPFIMMHMKGTPQNMKQLAKYDDVVLEVKQFFSERIKLAREKGMNDIIIDPGFGFAKNSSHNFQLLHKYELLKSFDLPLLCGVSRKSMIYKTLGVSANEALNGTTALHSLALYKGANIIRVHDVKEANECILLYNELLKHQ
jgi:dihydropteroate synthase